MLPSLQRMGRVRNRARQFRNRRIEAVIQRSAAEPLGSRRTNLYMGNQQGSFLTAIDVGSAKTCALVAELTDAGLRYRGHGLAESRGDRKGTIVELDKAVASIQKAVEAAEDIAGAPVEHAIIGIGGGHVRGVNS